MLTPEQALKRAETLRADLIETERRITEAFAQAEKMRTDLLVAGTTNVALVADIETHKIRLFTSYTNAFFALNELNYQIRMFQQRRGM